MITSAPFTQDELLKIAASNDARAAKLAVQLLETKAEVAACCNEIKKLGGRAK